jgi:hypothetical protein
MSNFLKKQIYSENQHNVHEKCGIGPLDLIINGPSGK